MIVLLSLRSYSLEDTYLHCMYFPSQMTLNLSLSERKQSVPLGEMGFHLVT